MKQNNQSSQQNPSHQTRPQVTSRVRINPATPQRQEKEELEVENREQPRQSGKQPGNWNEQEFRQKTDGELDIMDVVQPFVMAHEGVKNWHDALLSKVGLGEVNRKVWAMVDKVRDNSLVMLKRQYGKKNRKQTVNSPHTAQKQSHTAPSSSAASSSSSDDTTQ